MNNEIENLINLYFDGELEKGREAYLFTVLSGNEEARSYFKQMHSIKSNIQFTIEEFPAKLDENILRSVGKSKTGRTFKYIDKKIFDAVVYTAAVVLIVLSIFFYSKSEEYKVQFFDLTREVKKQNEQLQLIMNALPEIEVYSDDSDAKQVVYKPRI
jgi:hypothetical protein